MKILDRLVGAISPFSYTVIKDELRVALADVERLKIENCELKRHYELKLGSLNHEIGKLNDTVSNLKIQLKIMEGFCQKQSEKARFARLMFRLGWLTNACVRDEDEANRYIEADIALAEKDPVGYDKEMLKEAIRQYEEVGDE